MLLWPRLVCGSTAVPQSSPCPHLPKPSGQATGGPGTLLISPFNVKWRFSVLAGGVEGSKFCLLSVILSPVSLQDFTIGLLSASSLYPPSWNPPPTLFLTEELKTYYEEKTTSATNVAGKSGYLLQKTETIPMFITLY
jgi:hypothetical protein